MPYKKPLDRQAVVEMYLKPNSTADVALAFGCNPETIRTRLIEWGVPRHPQKNLPRPQPNKARKMEQNGFWQGGRVVTAIGYVKLKMNDHPDCSRNGYIWEHRLVMEKHLGRRLLSTEVVHHKDGNGLNNAIDNLELFATNGEHLKSTLKGKRPRWSAEGYARFRQGSQRWFDQQASIRKALEAYAGSQGLTLSTLRSRLTLEGLHLLRTVLMRSESLPLEELMRTHGRIVPSNTSARQSH